MIFRREDEVYRAAAGFGLSPEYDAFIRERHYKPGMGRSPDELRYRAKSFMSPILPPIRILYRAPSPWDRSGPRLVSHCSAKANRSA